MISSKMSSKWQSLAEVGRKGLVLLQRTKSLTRSSSSSSLNMVTEKGHFVVYTTDERRFTLPLMFLESDIFRELLKLSGEEFGLTSNSPIILNCDSVFMEYVMSVIQSQVGKEVERALVTSLFDHHNALLMHLHNEQSALTCC